MAPSQPTWDKTTFEVQFKAHVRHVVRYTERRLVGNDAVWDVVAETFTIAWQHSEKAPASSDEVVPWLYAIAANVIRNTQRAHLRRNDAARRSWLLADAGREGNDETDARLDAQRVLSPALAQLSDDDQEVLRLVAWEDLNLAQVAVALGVSSGAAKVRLHRARRRLRELLSTQPPGLSSLSQPPDELSLPATNALGRTRGRSRQ